MEQNEVQFVSYIEDPGGHINERLIPDVPVAIYGLSDGVKARYKSLLEQGGSVDSPEELIVLAEGTGEPITEQMFVALGCAQAKTLMAGMPAGDCVVRVGNSYRHAVEVNGPVDLFSNKEKKKIPFKGILLCKDPLVDEPQYIRARNVLMQEANRILRIFDAEFRIPNFPPMENRPTI